MDVTSVFLSVFCLNWIALILEIREDIVYQRCNFFYIINMHCTTKVVYIRKLSRLELF